MTRSRRLVLALAATALLAVFGGAVQGVATTRGEIQPGTPAAGALERLRDQLGAPRSGDGAEGERSLRRMSTADCPWLRDDETS
jgi:hypothetical protein